MDFKATLTPVGPLRIRSSPSSCLALLLYPNHIGLSAILEDRRGTSAPRRESADRIVIYESQRS
jgi:hypothetical protein